MINASTSSLTVNPVKQIKRQPKTTSSAYRARAQSLTNNAPAVTAASTCLIWTRMGQRVRRSNASSVHTVILQRLIQNGNARGVPTEAWSLIQSFLNAFVTQIETSWQQVEISVFQNFSAISFSMMVSTLRTARQSFIKTWLTQKALSILKLWKVPTFSDNFTWGQPSGVNTTKTRSHAKH